MCHNKIALWGRSASFPSFAIGLVEIESKFIVRSVEVLVVAVISVDVILFGFLRPELSL